jgi:hypothetical protein
MNLSRFSLPTVLMFGLLLAVCTVRAWSSAQTVAGIDFYQFWVGGQAITRGEISALYNSEGRERLGEEFFKKAHSAPDAERLRIAAENRRVLETVSTPFLFALTALFSSGDYETDYQRFVLLSLACLLGAIFTFGQIAGASLVAILGISALLLSLFEPELSELRVANVNSLQLGMLATYLWLQCRSRLPEFIRETTAGALLGMAVAFKPNTILVPALLLCSWAGARKFARLQRTGLGIAAGAVTALLFACAYSQSSNCWLDWAAQLSQLNEMAPLSFGNTSLSRLLFDATGLDPSLLILIACCAFTAFRVVSAGTKGNPVDEMLIVGIGCVIFLLASKLVWLHYLLLTTPLIFPLLRDANRKDRFHWAAGGAFTLILLATSPPIFGDGPRTELRVVLVNLGLISLFLLALRDIGRSRIPTR